MGRPTTKDDLLTASSNNYEKLNTILNGLSEKEVETPFMFGEDKKEAHWKRDKNLRDVLVHLYEWHQLLLNFVKENANGNEQPFIPAPYNWKTYGAMNVGFWEKHQDTALEDAKQMLSESHKTIMKVLESYSNEDLFSKGVFPWVGGTTLGSYFISATASHYDWAAKKLKAHIKICKDL